MGGGVNHHFNRSYYILDARSILGTPPVTANNTYCISPSGTL